MRAHPLLARHHAAGVGWVLVLAAAALPAYLFLHVASGKPVYISGSDAFGYTWQIRILGSAGVGAVGARPGVAGVGSILAGLHILSPGIASPVLGLAMGAALALACGAIVRIAFGLPPSAVGIVAAFVALWTGTARMGSGYLANLVSLVAFVAAAGLVGLSGRPRALLGAGVCALAAGLAHPGFLPVYAGICVAWGVASLPGHLPRKAPRNQKDRAGRPLSGTEPMLTLAAVLVAGVAAAAMLLIVWRIPPSEIADFQVQEMGARLGQAAERLLTPLPVIAAVLGAVLVWFGRRSEASRVLCRLGLGWLAVSLGGALLGLLWQSFPGHRALLVALPMPVAAGTGAAIAVGLFGSPGVGRAARLTLRTAAAVASVAVLLVCARPGLAMYRGPRATPAAMEVVAYVSAVRPQVPVVIVMQPAGLTGILFWKARLNEIRAFAPVVSVDRIVPYLGRADQALSGRQTLIQEPVGEAAQAFNRVSGRLWRDYGAQVSDPASIVLAPREFVSQTLWDVSVANAQGLATPDLAVLRGPLPGPLPAMTPPSSTPLVAWLESVMAVLAVAVAGGGFAAGAMRSRGGKAIDMVALAPAFGTVVLMLAALGLATVGGDPAGPLGVAIVVLVAAAGYLWAVISSRADSTRSTSPGEW